MTIKYLLYGSLLAMSVSCSDILNKKDLSAVTDRFGEMPNMQQLT